MAVSEEKTVVVAEISEEAAAKTHHTILSVFTSPRVWLMGTIFFGIEMGSYASRILAADHHPPDRRQRRIRYRTADHGALYPGSDFDDPCRRHADKTRERRWHVVVPCIVAALGFALCAQAGSSTMVAMIGLITGCGRRGYGNSHVLGVADIFLGGAAAAAGIALVNCTGNLGGFLSPAIIGFLKDYTGTLNSGLFLVSGCMLASAILIVATGPGKTGESLTLAVNHETSISDQKQIQWSREGNGDDKGLRKGLTSYGDAGFSLFLRKAFIKAMGYSDDALDRPIVGVTNTVQ
jgi:hypothetical protein